MPPAMTSRTVPPATRESRKLFREGVTAASAARGEARAAPAEARMAACMTWALFCCWALWKNGIMRSDAGDN